MDKKNDDNIPKEINCYKIGKLLYSYGIYKVHIGTNSLTKEEVTIKIINKKNINDNSNLLSSINNDIFFSKILTHNNILKLVDIYESSVYIFIIMESFKGEFLSSYMSKHKRLEEPEALKIFSKIISAMIYIHNMNICHLDINLDSILIDENDKNKIKICDFKFGQYYYTKFKTLNKSVESNMFTCPEVSMSDGYIPELADVWSSGILLCYLLTGEYPINTDKELDSNERYIVPNNISKNLQDLLKNILDIDIDKRYRFDDILHSEYFIDNNYSNEILEENKNNHIIEKMNLRKIYERYLKEKSYLEKEQNQNLLINLENIINQDNSIDNKRKNKALEINEVSKNDKENNRNLINKNNKINTFKSNDNNKINSNQIKKKRYIIRY
jgi:serine/threonine protein kinase